MVRNRVRAYVHNMSSSIVSASSPSSTRGQIVLQPVYFSSSAFVLPARADVESLLREFSLQYTSSSVRPFALFKHIWQAHGWTWIHFKVLDARSRVAFLRVMMRLFSGEFVHAASFDPPNVFQNGSEPWRPFSIALRHCLVYTPCFTCSQPSLRRRCLSLRM